MKLKITVLPGDGIGPEVTREAVRILETVAEAYDHNFEFDEQPVGGAGIKQLGSPLPTATLDACLNSEAVLLGAVGSPEYDALPPERRPEAGLLTLRQALSRVHPEQRRAIEMAYFGGLTYEETAERLELPVGTLKSRIRSEDGRIWTMAWPSSSGGPSKTSNSGPGYGRWRHPRAMR